MTTQLGSNTLDRARLLYSPALRYFAAVAEHGAIRAASRELNVASSAVNRQILWLEESLGVPLFERVGRRLQLSPAGEILLRHVTSVLRDFEQTSSELDALRGLKRGIVRIASVESVATELLADLAASFGKSYPDIQLRITVTHSDNIARQVLDSDADIGFSFDPPDEDLLAVNYSHDFEIGAVVIKDHPLAQKSTCSFEDCLDYPIILPSRGLSLRSVIDRLLAKIEMEPSVFAEVSTLQMMRRLAARDLGICFQTRIGLHDSLDHAELCFLPLSDEQLQCNKLSIVTHHQRKLKLAPAMFLSHAQQFFKQRYP
ncbi:LysR family transcriptional regulator [uncultured Cohaesibacter sp.]|uniref:LysR family transcriptional regulator n=1 Tax=uncultured Cohaesibacter sp. TaxID=1002546 RepID=UPI00292EF9D2|nr:LysR family transcriptional regulator [uncultured Cohaesibacter sp.]